MQEKLRQLQAYNFAAYDMLLYLDTHPNDKKGFEIFKSLVEKVRQLKREYEKEYGPIGQFSSAMFDSFEWLQSPWPWEKEGN